MGLGARREFGDFQTPLPLVREILAELGPIGRRWTRVLEPTCGSGNFIRGILESECPPAEIVGIEVQEPSIAEARSLHPMAVSKGCRLDILRASIFDVSLGADLPWHTQGPLLVLGNPPWITNSELGSLESTNLPRKSNLKGLKGILALTGHSNFDIAEFIWIKLLTELRGTVAHIALLCKTSVARNVLAYARSIGLPVSDAAIRTIDARRWFGAAVDACLFRVEVNAGPASYEADVFASLTAREPVRRLGFAGSNIIADIAGYRAAAFMDGTCPVEWRQGIKHDAASVMELRLDGGVYRNRQGEPVDVEDGYMYPLLKSSSLAGEGRISPDLSVVVPQTGLSQDSRPLRHVAPRLWAYLSNHAAAFDARKSSVYKGKPPFSIFGVGDYSFAPYKVVVSGLHKRPRFVPVGSYRGKPILCDDTCYLAPCESAVQAAALAALLNHPMTLSFIDSIVFHDAKRPVTKAVLSRIDLAALACRLSRSEMNDLAAHELDAIVGDPREEDPVWPDDIVEIIRPATRKPMRSLFA